MSSFIFDKAKLKIAKKEIDFIDDTFKIALVTSAAFVDPGPTSNLENWGDVSATCEITTDGSYSTDGYVAGGVELTNVDFIEVEDGRFTAFTVSATDVDAWDGGVLSTIDADGAIIYDTSASNANICAIDFGSKASSSNGALTVPTSNGWLTLQ